MSNARTATPASTSFLGVLRNLHNIKIGGASTEPTKMRVKRQDLCFIIGNLATLVENGVSLPKALDTLAREPSLKKYSSMLDTLRRKVESGEAFSSALNTFPATFNQLMVHQIRVGERSGKVGEALLRVTEQLEHANELRAKIMKRMAYPMIVLTAGTGVVGFMLTYIVPTFEETYRKSNIPLPTPTRVLIGVGDFGQNYGWIVVLLMIVLPFLFVRARRVPSLARVIDGTLLKIPVLGGWCRDVAVLQFMEALGTMMESGFKVADALGNSAGSVGNRVVRESVEELRAAVLRGERLSRQLEKQTTLFPPIVSQLVIVGEQTGNLAKSTRYVREHLHKDIERRADIFIGTLEPVLTISMALAICGILLAIYMPMFGMMDAVRAG